MDFTLFERYPIQSVIPETLQIIDYLSTMKESIRFYSNTDWILKNENRYSVHIIVLAYYIMLEDWILAALIRKNLSI